ncbi:Transcription activator of gluconeogenesis ERT1-2 [Neolecta irregularis DAH-3]|uniref:Transcription activator of gluconeogenesis ERT1-2 n=1 Tax=Neolecta irregularis (strain DAH-3) TaxID=1198029 RepID=A0A1U7LTQ8_NEOID|nr:Transcription activator of gluconeogenesis ERT1-2 [Neolecta irregularis DAH-3]|eukprot:OLL26056.1 Transcription activator of gluconeogenesis ERT1-2 [Neolecta irregularis DAH-3]
MYNHSLPPLSALISYSDVRSQLSPPRRRRRNKPNVGVACTNCRQGHYSCDSDRPCAKCVSRGKEDSCVSGQYRYCGRRRSESYAPKRLPLQITSPTSNSPPYADSVSSASGKDSTSEFAESRLPHISPFECVFITTLDFVCAIVSSSVRPALGYYPAELEGLPLPSLFNPSDEDRSRQIVYGITEKKALTCFEIQRLDPHEQRLGSPNEHLLDVNIRHACGIYQSSRCSFRVGLTRTGIASHVITVMTTPSDIGRVPTVSHGSTRLNVTPESTSDLGLGK